VCRLELDALKGPSSSVIGETERPPPPLPGLLDLAFEISSIVLMEDPFSNPSSILVGDGGGVL